MALQNTWVRYIDRSYQQIKDRVFTDLASLVPEITDHTDSNPFVKIISIFSGLVEMLNYYIDNAAREAYLSVARLLSSGIKIANMLDYNVKISNPASVDLLFTLENVALTDVTVPQYTEVGGSAYDFTFLTKEALIIPVGSLTGSVGAKEIKRVASLNVGTSNGLINQIIVLEPTNIALNSIVPTINSIVWTEQDTLAYSNSTDTHFVVTVNTDNEIVMQFGDDITGAIPANGFDIVIDYFETEGTGGNVVITNSLTDINTSVTVPSEAGDLIVTNDIAAAGGTDIETLEELKSRIPKSLRTLRKALTELDYKDLADMFVGVLKSEVNHECGFPTDIYIVPTGGGLAPDALLVDLETYFDDKHAINMLVSAKAAGQLSVDLIVDVNALSNYQNTDVKTRVNEALVDLLSWENQEISGDLYLSDLFFAIDNVEGTKNSNITAISLNSYPRKLTTTINELDLTVVTNVNNSTTYKYNVVMLSTTEFQLTRDSVYLGNYFTDVPIILTEGNITVSGTYTPSDNWEFYIYKNLLLNRIVTIDEYSVPIADNLTINITGGY